MLTQDQIKANINALEQQGAKQPEIQQWLNTLKNQKDEPSIQPTNYSFMKPAAPDASLAEKAVRGVGNLAANVFGKAGEVVGAVSSGITDFAAGAVSAPKAALTGQTTAVNPFSGNQVKPWFSGGTGPGGVQTMGQFTGEVLQHGAEIAPWLMGGGEAAAGAKAGIAASKGAKLVQIAKASLPLATGFGTSGAVGEAGKQLQSGEANIPKIIATGLSDFALGLGAEMGVRTIASKLAGTKGVITGGGKTPPPGGVDKSIVSTVDKVFKPTTKSVSTPALRDAYYKKADTVFNVIDDIKPEFKDMSGNVVTDRNPKTLYEVYQAFPTAKENIFKTYDTIAQQSGEMGAQFNPQPIIDKLTIFSQDLSHSPQIRDYAAKQAELLPELRGASPSVVQSRIKELNSGLEGLYLGADKPKLNVDASIAEQLRSNLDTLIENTTGETYQPLKNIYGSFSAVEKDLNRAMNNYLKKSKTSMTGITDIFTGAEITAAVLTANPGLLIKGLAGKGIKETLLWFTNPDRYIKNVFSNIEKSKAAGVIKNNIVSKAKAASQIVKDKIALKAKQKAEAEALRIKNTPRLSAPKGTPINGPTLITPPPGKNQMLPIEINNFKK